MAGNPNENQAFLDRLTSIAEANLTNDQFGVAELAREMGLSRSYIYRQLKKLTSQSISHFIRNVRLDKAMKMLRETDDSVSEVAFKVGFGSPAYFNHCFHERFGFPPGEVRKSHLNEPAPLSTRGYPENTRPDSAYAHKAAWINKNRKLFFSVSGVLFLVLLLYIFYYGFNTESFSKKKIAGADKSIMVLPFKNLSSDEENQYFADGIAEDILNHLYRIEELRVISRTSSEQFRDSKLSVAEISQELNVNYILEGSVRREDEKIRINVQFIDAKNDQHLWAENYDREITDIFAIQSDIAKNVADALQLFLSTTEKQQIEKIPTKNTEAYNYYLMGRYFLYQRPEEKCKNSIAYFEKAIEADPKYSDAYAGLSNAYYLLTWHKFFPLQEGKIKSKQNALKALGLNENQTEAHVVLGALEMWFNWNWDEAEKEFIKALKLNPKHPEANQYYSEYLDVVGKTEEARFYLDQAISLYPYSKIMYAISSNHYLREKNYQAALKENQKVLEFDAHDELALWRNFRIYFHLNEDKKMIEELKRISSLKNPNDRARETIDSLYADNQMSDIIHWAIDWIEENEDLDDFYIATIAALICDRETTLKYLNRSVNNSFRAPRIKFYPDFAFLQNDPEFQIILEKLNLQDD
jgi:TolB-like protein/AraC-like DNA-binding protein